MALTAVMVNRITMGLKEEVYGPLKFEKTRDVNAIATIDKHLRPPQRARVRLPRISLDLEKCRSVDLSQIIEVEYESCLLRSTASTTLTDSH